MIKGSVLQEDIIILNVYAPNNRVSNYMRPKLIELQEERDEFTIILETSIPLSQKWTDPAGRKSVRT